MKLQIPELSLVVLAGPSGSGKTTFAHRLFGKYEVVSSDVCRGMVSNDENNQDATSEAFDLLYYIVSKRLQLGYLTVVDATNVKAEDRKKLIQIARAYHALPTIIVLDMPHRVCEERNESRPDRTFGARVIRRQRQELRRSMRGLKREGFRKIHVLKSPEEVEAISAVEREKLYNDKKEIKGPFDIIGDIHGCHTELVTLLKKLGYVFESVPDDGANYGLRVQHPENRQPVFLGDLVDRGPNAPAVLKLVMSMVNQHAAHCVPGNHDIKLLRKLKGKKVKINHGLEQTLEQLESETPEFLEALKRFLDGLISHYVLDGGKLVVAHAGLKEEMQGRASGEVRAFCLYGDTTGEVDEFGLPVRYDWAMDYRGKAKVVYGHTPVPEAEWLNRTINIDTGCVFGGKLTALRYPEDELVSVPARKVYWESIRLLKKEQADAQTNQQAHDDVLNIEDVTGRRIVQTRLYSNITIHADNAIAALEVMSRFAVDPKWLIYLPPTMSPCETSDLPDYLEHPMEALHYYKKRGVERVICEEKHMGSRAIIVLCQDESVAARRFGVEEDRFGICYTRTGRPFFTEGDLENRFLQRLHDSFDRADFWGTHQTDWVCLDAELMPWSAKAQALLQRQYASVGAAARHSLGEAEIWLQKAGERGLEGIEPVLAKYGDKKRDAARFTQAYRHYCWEVKSIADYRLAPFHILATEGKVHTDKSHQWHMEAIRAVWAADNLLFLATPYRIVDTADEACIREAINWWEELTEKGGEGFVVKPFDFIAYGAKGLLQPAIKCRGRDYLRIIYGPDYDFPDHLSRLKQRGLSRKRSLALKEFALGVEALERFVRREPLRYVHESVFGVLALESESVDPRL